MEDKNKKEFIAKKMKILVGEENYDKSQAYAIALSYWNKNHKQEGGEDKPMYQWAGMYLDPNIFNNNFVLPNTTPPQQDFSVENQDRLRNYYTPATTPTDYSNSISLTPEQLANDTGEMTTPISKEQRRRMAQNKATNSFYGNYDENGNAVDATIEGTQANKRYNIINPFGGMDLSSSLSYTGRAFGEGKTAAGIGGAALSLFKGARDFMGGYASGKESQRVRNEYFDNTFNYNPNYVNYQEGGEKKPTNAMMLTGEFIADEGTGNTIMEGDEFVKRADSGLVQKVVGEPHVKGGKIAEGVEANLNNGDKVLSTYVKIPAKDVKELKERYQLSLKKGATFADAQKAFDKKIGIQKTTDELVSYIEKLGKNESVKDETAKRLNELAITKEIEEYKTKLDTLKEPQAMVFEDLFSRQEKIEKKGDGKTLFDKNGKEVTEVAEDVKQQGGYKNIEELAKKHGLSVERATELVNMMQEGGISKEDIVQQDQMQQVFQAVAQMLQEGQTPDQVIETLIQQGVPHEQAMGIVGQIAQQMQQPAQEMAQEGLKKRYDKFGNEIKIDFSALKNAFKAPLYTQPEPTTDTQTSTTEPQTSVNNTDYTFRTKYTPNIEGYNVEDISITPTDTLSGVEYWQPYTGKGYGAKMSDVEKTIDTHKWYFDTEEKKKAFREAVAKEGESPEIRKFQESYNEELLKRAKSAGVPETEAQKIINEVGFTGKGVQQFDGKYGAFTSTRPLFNFSKKDGEVKVDVKPVVGEEKVITYPEDRTENVLPWLPQNLRLSPSSLDPIAKEEIYLPRMEPIKTTVEPMLAEQERQRATEVAKLESLGLSPQQEAALMASGLATSQLSANDAIAKVEQANTQQQFAADQFNLNQEAKETITNAQFRNDYQNKVMQSLANQERDWKNYYTDIYLDQANKFKYIDNMNLVNAENSNYQVIPGEGLRFLNNKSVNYANPELEKAIEDLSIDQRNIFKKQVIGGKTREEAYLKAKGLA